MNSTLEFNAWHRSFNAVEQVREKYPKPSRARPDTKIREAYCVGGALCLFIGSTMRFPCSGDLANILRSLNIDLSDDAAITYADAIIRKNDSGDFDGAWDYLSGALCHRKAKS